MSPTPAPPRRTIFEAGIHTEDEGGYWAEVPNLPGCFTQGKTLDEVYRNLAEAVACHLDIEESQVEIELSKWLTREGCHTGGGTAREGAIRHGEGVTAEPSASRSAPEGP